MSLEVRDHASVQGIAISGDALSSLQGLLRRTTSPLRGTAAAVAFLAQTRELAAALARREPGLGVNLGTNRLNRRDSGGRDSSQAVIAAEGGSAVHSIPS